MNHNQLKQYLFSLLTQREYSEWELKKKLSLKTNDERLIQDLITEFKVNGWQSDQRLIETLINSKKNRYGHYKLEQDLTNKGIDSTLFATLLPNAAEQLEVAIQLLQKKYKTFENTPKSKQKCFRFLHSKGFKAEIIYEAIHQLTCK